MLATVNRQLLSKESRQNKNLKEHVVEDEDKAVTEFDKRISAKKYCFYFALFLPNFSSAHRNELL